ncbi:hypothetical protein ACIP10_15295 [Streptomyces galbus]|uniref:hypothetical protein n=1 Tax=Streptomyces galbus TaxID=33898 RepID=UPI0037B46BB9
MKISRYWKAIVAGAAAGTATLSTALQDGTLTTGETITTVLAVLGGLGLTWAVPNQPKTDA